jgi:hypothetical protein
MKKTTRDNYDNEYQRSWLKAHPGYGKEAARKWLAKRIKKAIKAYIQRTNRKNALKESQQ